MIAFFILQVSLCFDMVWVPTRIPQIQEMFILCHITELYTVMVTNIGVLQNSDTFYVTEILALTTEPPCFCHDTIVGIDDSVQMTKLCHRDNNNTLACLCIISLIESHYSVIE